MFIIAKFAAYISRKEKQYGPALSMTAILSLFDPQPASSYPLLTTQPIVQTNNFTCPTDEFVTVARTTQTSC